MKSSTPGRLACVDLPAFPLQLLLRRHPEWAGYPAAVVAEDKPQGLVLWVNEAARELGVLPGLRYAARFHSRLLCAPAKFLWMRVKKRLAI
jgi:nucleotidyltransferase/DNA polymerase involved in DNA repair